MVSQHPIRPVPVLVAVLVEGGVAQAERAAIHPPSQAAPVAARGIPVALVVPRRMPAPVTVVPVVVVVVRQPPAVVAVMLARAVFTVVAARVEKATMLPSEPVVPVVVVVVVAGCRECGFP